MVEPSTAEEILARSLFDEAEMGAERGLVAALGAMADEKTMPKIAKVLPPEFGKTVLQAHKRKREKRWEHDRPLYLSKATRLLVAMGADPTAAIRQTSERVSKIAAKLVNVSGDDLLALDAKSAGAMAKRIRSVSASALAQDETPDVAA